MQWTQILDKIQWMQILDKVLILDKMNLTRIPDKMQILDKMQWTQMLDKMQILGKMQILDKMDAGQDAVDDWIRFGGCRYWISQIKQRGDVCGQWSKIGIGRSKCC
eukprot:EG_transcript_29260